MRKCAGCGLAIIGGVTIDGSPYCYPYCWYQGTVDLEYSYGGTREKFEHYERPMTSQELKLIQLMEGGRGGWAAFWGTLGGGILLCGFLLSTGLFPIAGALEMLRKNPYAPVAFYILGGALLLLALTYLIGSLQFQGDLQERKVLRICDRLRKIRKQGKIGFMNYFLLEGRKWQVGSSTFDKYEEDAFCTFEFSPRSGQLFKINGETPDLRMVDSQVI